MWIGSVLYTHTQNSPERRHLPALIKDERPCHVKRKQHPCSPALPPGSREHWCQAHSPRKSEDTVSAEEAAKHRKTKVADKSGQIAQPLTQLRTLRTAWNQTLTRCCVYVRTHPEQSAAEEEWVRMLSDEQLPLNLFKNMFMGEKAKYFQRCKYS